MAEETVYDFLQETLIHEQLDNGLSVFIVPKPKFNKTYATFTTNYGSVDNHFVPLGKDEARQVPDGIAHFLEHKMFEDEEGDVFQVFGENGAQANAFTSFTRTAYLFSSTENAMTHIETLLNFVQHPYFTEESVEKEKGIINQEIRMYDDNPDWQLFFGLLRSMYEQHPVKVDIAGTTDSIDEITKDDLYECYKTFYHPSQMALVISGPVDTEEVLGLIRNNQAEKTFAPPEDVQRFYPEEPAAPVEPHKVTEMSVATPKCLIGFKEKDPGRQGEALLRREASLQIALDMLFGPGSEAYEALYEEGIIDDSFSTDYTAEKTFGFSVLGGDTKHPETLKDRVFKVFETMQQKDFDADAFERAKKKKIGRFLKQLNSPEFIANQYTRYQFNEMDLFQTLPVLESLTLEDVTEAARDHFEQKQAAVHIVQREGS